MGVWGGGWPVGGGREVWKWAGTRAGARAGEGAVVKLDPDTIHLSMDDVDALLCQPLVESLQVGGDVVHLVLAAAGVGGRPHDLC